MRSNLKRPVLTYLAISAVFILDLGFLLAAKPVLGKESPRPRRADPAFRA